MLFSQLFFIGDDDVKLVFLASDLGLDLGYPVGEVFAFGGLVVAVGGIGPGLNFVLVGLGLDVVEGDFALVDLVVEGPEFVLGLLGILGFVFQLGNQLLVVVFGLMQSFVQFGVDGLVIPDGSLEILQFLNIGVKEGIESIALFFQSLPLIFQSFELNRWRDTVMARFLFYSLVLWFLLSMVLISIVIC